MLVRTALTALPEPRLRGWGIAGVVAASLIAAVVAVQVWFTLRWERQIRHTGLLQAPTWIIVLSDSEPPDDRSVIETLPLRDRKGLARSFLRDFGIGHPLAERRAHGAMDQLRREDKGFLFDVAGRRAGATPVDPALHYVVLPARGPGLDRRRPAVACRSVRDRCLPAYRGLCVVAVERAPRRRRLERERGRRAGARAVMPAGQQPDATVFADIPSTRWPANAVVFRGRMSPGPTSGPPGSS